MKRHQKFSLLFRDLSSYKARGLHPESWLSTSYQGSTPRSCLATSPPVLVRDAAIPARLKSDLCGPAWGSSESSGILEQTLMDRADYPPQVVGPGWYVGENSSNLLLPGKGKITLHMSEWIWSV